MANVATMSSEILDAFNKVRQACALCSLWVREEASVTDKIKTEGQAMNPGLRDGVFAASGFCNRHTHAIHDASPSGTLDYGLACPSCAQTVLKKFEDDLAPLLANLQAAKGQAERGGKKGEQLLSETISALEKTISGDAVCPVCERLLESDRDRIASMLQMLESKDFADLYLKSDAVCMPHFVSAIELLPWSGSKNAEGVWSILVRAELVRLEAVDYLLNERMKKYSWDFRNEAMTPEEANAQKIAMLAIAGVEGLYCRPRKTSLRPARQ
jgi:hypothetical protein